MTPLRVPKAAVSMVEGTLLEWLVEDGAVVAEGQPLYSIETEKTSMEVVAPCAGKFTRIGQVGETYPVGHLIATIDDTAESAEA